MKGSQQPDKREDCEVSTSFAFHLCYSSFNIQTRLGCRQVSLESSKSCPCSFNPVL